jgi:hypothetical protein
VFLFFVFFILDFAFDEVEELRLSPLEEGMAEDVFGGVFSAFVEAVHVELSDEGVDVAVPEVFGEDVILEVIDLFDGELSSVIHPMNDRLVLLVIKDLEALLDEVCNCIVGIVNTHSLYFLISIV